MREDCRYIEKAYLMYKREVEKVKNKRKFISDYKRSC